MEITLRQLDYFLALARERHFGRAAEACHVTQPALSAQIREMEARLGTRLVERSDRRLGLTPAGVEVLRSAQAIRRELERLERAISRRVGLEGRLRLGVIPTVAPYLVPVAIPMMKAGRAALDLRVREARTEDLLGDLLDGRLDAAVLALPSGRRGLDERDLCTDRFLLAGRADELAALAAGGAPSPDALDPARLLLLDEGHCLADQALEVCGLDRARLGPDLGAASLSTLARLAAEGFGLTFLPEIAAAAETGSAPGLAVIRFAEPQPRRRIGLVRRMADDDAGWFDELATVLAEACRKAVAASCGAVVASPAPGAGRTCDPADGHGAMGALQQRRSAGDSHA